MVAAVVITPPPSPPIHSLSNTTTNPHYHHLLTLITHCTAMPQLKQIHANALRTLSPDHPSTLFLHSRLVHFSASTDLDYASRLLHHIDNPNSFIWNTVIRAHAWNPHRKIEAFRLYRKMLMDGRVKQDKHTFPLVLKALAYLSWLSEGMQVHAHVVKLGYASDVYINNSLVHFYVSCGRVYVGRKVFDEMPERSLVSWNVMIDGYVEVGEFETALGLFVELQEKELFAPDGFTMQTVVCACGGMSALSLGMWAHAYVLRKCGVGVVGDALLKNSLLDMYCKCGSLEQACQVFDSMRRRDVATWNSMIMGFAMHGKVEKALEAFETMREDEEIAPNSITFVSVLSACNHGGLVEEGRRYFDLMVSKYKIEPQLEHYGCMVDLLARAGLIDDALNLVADMHVKPDVVIWRSLLDACCKQNVNLELTEEVGKQLLESDGGVCSGAYVLLSRVYASGNRWNDVGLLRRIMSEKGIVKEPGCSSIELDGEVHQFLAGDTSHPCTNEIYKALDVINKKLESARYIADLTQAPMVDDLFDEKQHSLRLHSERLAIAFGLLNAKPGTPIRIFKNLRVCNDCHAVTKLISKLFDVEIVVRDRARFHHFKHGFCSCKDYW